MALTPEDVVNKRFNPTKFREGYDQDEVDDFLDEVVVELRRLNQENEELRQRLVASDARISELQRSASQAPVAAPAPVPAAPPVSAAPVPAPSAAPEYGAQDAGAIDQTNTNNLLQLARRLHEEHVREGMEKRDQLIAEGHATAARIVSDAETQQRTRIESLDQERQGLERRVEELRIFESEYREQLRGYIESQLHELDASAPISTPEAAETPAVGSSAPVYGDQPAPAEAAPAYSSSGPQYGSSAPEYPAPDPYGQASSPSSPPAYAAFPAPQVSPEYPAQQSEPPQSEYPSYAPRTDNPGLGGN
ncbi:DivIVA domain-containing protein [Homoserinibacter sp. GY 40078]|uniref:DivIVA domain-containing protein n=1 Tax=Homoserinibacter sp. GY 40078 TaxID=2603275 RepID=UPI0011C9E434|nr:DivIVA domain-containing protein [Homoserinibacter sp. GY 40078]